MTEPNLNMELVEEALPQVDESELVYGAKLPPFPEGTYNVRSKLGSKGKSFDKAKGTWTVHAENQIVKALRVSDPQPADKPTDLQKVLFKDDGSGKSIHDFFRINPSNLMGINKAVQFLKYAGDPDYAKYKTASQLAQAVEDALRQEPDHIKLNGRWEASLEVGVDPNTGKKKYESKRGMRQFPLRADGSRSHIVEIDGEQVPAQLVVTEYGEVTAKDRA